MIELKNITIHAGSFTLRNISMEIQTGEYAALMGRTGQGKTTLLEAICGLRKVASGKVFLDGTDVTDWSPSDRGIGYVPQDLALFPNLTVREHIAFALRLRRQASDRITQRVNELAALLHLTVLLDRCVTHLSGGESQRVALGRALSFGPAVLLLDEPLSALDEATRQEMHTLLRQVHQTSQMTILHVTHNAADAHALAGQRFKLEKGIVTSG